MKVFRGTLVVVIVAAALAVATGVARADDGGGTTTKATCGISFVAGVLTVSCTTPTGVTYICKLQRTATGSLGLDCSNSSSTAHLTCTFTYPPFRVDCKRE
jgi:hypothetical protein